MEKGEGVTAGLWVSWATRFCQDAGARREQSFGGNGGRLDAALWEAKNANRGVRVRRAGAGWLQDAVGRARAPTARGLHAQAIDDGWCHASKVF